MPGEGEGEPEEPKNILKLQANSYIENRSSAHY